ncbi:MAG: hypothetical protein RLZZ347_342 [Candidatus Parcubacteria bacterium]|jgi:type IV pilus assembly protein PilB
MGILDILANKDFIKRSDITSIKEEARLSGESIEQVLIKKGISSEEVLVAKGEVFNLPVRSLSDTPISFKILEFIPEESATHYKFVPLDLKDGVLEVGLVDPDDIDARDALNFISAKIGLPFTVFLISEDDFKTALQSYKGLSGEVTKALTELETEFSGDDLQNVLSQRVDATTKAQGNTRIIEDAPVTKIVATILRYATEGNASDIHIEPMADKVRVRFRVDGVLNTSLVLPLKVHSAVVARIKILCQTMKLDEKRKPQDGGFWAKIEGHKIDFRVSTFPSYYGEKVVMRILDQERGTKKIEDMGMTPQNVEMLLKAIKRPYGLILISGPTGSGKTTTLYGLLEKINDEGKNIMSLEDPIEYTIAGVNQSQVRPEIGYTFASGLRTSLRQDPDIILVGEIRDKETAQLAIQAALTGHLVLSTIHTNTSAGIVPRLLDMGVDPYLIPPTLILGMGQRLVSALCPNSGKPVPVEGSLKMMLEKQFSDLPEAVRKAMPVGNTVYEISPDANCPNGTRGRVAVTEMFMMDKDVEQVILKNPVESEIMKVLRAKGMHTMKEDAIFKAFKREIPFSEVNAL